MAIVGPTSFIPTTNEFLGHWAGVNTALGAGKELVIAEGASRPTLVGLLADLEKARDLVSEESLGRSLARALLTDQITILQGRMVEFNERIRADLPGSAYERVLSIAFSVGDAEGAVREGLRQVAKLWSKVNALALPPAGLVLPLVLRETYTLALFNAAREELRLAYVALSDADVNLRLVREQRNDVQDAIYVVLKNYRLKVPTVFSAGHAQVESLPLLTPPAGPAVAAVVAHATWDAAALKAKITWDASTETTLKHYEVRAVAGEEYDENDEALLATILPGQAREFFTDFALGGPNLTAGFRVYVVLESERERGSTPVFVRRPVG